MRSTSRSLSKALEPAWLEAASTSSSTAFLSIDCSSQIEACQKRDPVSSSSIQLFKGESSIATYQGPRRASGITSWIDRALRPSVNELSIESADFFENIDETVFIARIPLGGGASRLAVEEVARKYTREFTFGILGVSEHQDLDQDMPVIKCYRPLDNDVKSHTGPFDTASLETFVKEASRPIIGELLPGNHQRFLDRGWPMVYVFAATERDRAELRETLKKMARSYYDSLTMVTVDPLDFPELPEKLGLDPGSFPAGAVHQLSTDRIYRYPKGQPITANALQKWGLDVWQGRVRPWNPSGSTAVPETETQGRIKASRKISIKSYPGIKVNIGRDEL
ncbi:hypothetical protein PFICI_15407 [Pestalotiopsis fici W106-1]|uniref:protein disulfide-isomerase n=1 Tax=Pestalotiopsis fici (strain W106-1 / CGMCC3.15140) TaxID=1229662 RepID=W3WJ98_PESFW|nr:uncharacterized protein PFICI_15407 [Pestalotiopsis fici W106-1]ETS72876.1 hypothetical protein PFICI_15407 [Pestalotiopsis fici W106-1]